MASPGMVAFCTAGWPRIEDFWLSVNALFVPDGTLLSKASGVGIATMMTGFANQFMTYCLHCARKAKETGRDVDSCPHGESGRLQWMWILGDDHVFAENILHTLIDRAEQFKCDVLAPLVCRKVPPFDSVMFLTDRPLDLHDLPMQTDPVPVFRVGTAGMLIQRRVFEAMAKTPDVSPFRGTAMDTNQVGEDIHFCDLAQSLGFRIWVDPTQAMGHAPYGVSLWPVRMNDGSWMLQIQFPDQRSVLMSLERPDRSLTQSKA